MRKPLAILLSLLFITRAQEQSEIEENTLKYSDLEEYLNESNTTKIDDGLFDLYKYNSYNAINNYIDSLRNKTIVRVRNLATTYEGRKVNLVMISDDFAAKKPIIFVDANTHAREWVSGAVALHLIDTVIRSPFMRDEIDWYIVPMVNPDGYEYSRNHERLWRKNRSRYPGTQCVGVDLNRNYEGYWGTIGTSGDPCDPLLYAGPKALSEAETRGVSRALLDYRKKIKLYIAAHSYGPLVLYPLGYDTTAYVWNKVKLAQLGAKMARAMNSVNNNDYVSMNSATWYRTSGSSDDFAYKVAGIPYSYTIEFTDNSFEYPEDELATLYEESIEAFVVAAKEIGLEFRTMRNNLL